MNTHPNVILISHRILPDSTTQLYRLMQMRNDNFLQRKTH